MYFSGFRDLSFHNIGEFLLQKGFQGVLGPDLMVDGPHSYSWGFDECEFFQRTLTYLSQRIPEPKRLFVQIAVSRNHYPFPDGGFETARPFVNPENFVEQYLNSLAHQDACMDVFWKEQSAPMRATIRICSFLETTPGRSGINGNTFNEAGSNVENFAVPILYVPPRERRNEFVVGARPAVRSVGQTDLPSTVESFWGLEVVRILLPRSCAE